MQRPTAAPARPAAIRYTHRSHHESRCPAATRAAQPLPFAAPSVAHRPQRPRELPLSRASPGTNHSQTAPGGRAALDDTTAPQPRAV